MSAPASSTYLLRTADSTDLPNSRVLTAQNQLALTEDGGNYVLSPTGTLLSIVNAVASGLLGYNNTSKSVTPVTVTSTLGTINVTNPQGITGSFALNLDAAPSSSIQKVQVTAEGAAIISTQSTLNFIEGANTTIGVVNNAGSNRADITISSTPGASSINLTSTTGIRITGTGTDTLTVNLPGSTAVTYAVQEGDLLVGNNAGAYQALTATTAAEGNVLTLNGDLQPIWEAPGASDVVSVLLTSTTGLIMDPNTPDDGAVEIAVNLPGSGTASATVAGDTLYVPTNGAAYQALAANTATAGDVLTLNVSKVPVWATPTAGAAWYTVSNPAGGTGADVDMGAHAWNNVGSLQCVGVPSIPAVSAGFGTIYVDDGPKNYPLYKSSVLTNQHVVTCLATPNYGVANTILIGNGNDYTALAAPTTAGDVVGFNGTNIVWTANTPTVLPSGIATLTNATTASPLGYDSETHLPNPCIYFNVADSNVTASTVVNLTYVTTSMNGTTTITPPVVPPLYYSIVPTNFSDTEGNAWVKGYVIISSGSGGAGPLTVAYNVISY